MFRSTIFGMRRLSEFFEIKFLGICAATRRGVHPHDSAAAFPSPGARDPGRIRVARLKQEGSSRGRAGARISRRDLRCTRVMICGRPDRDPVRLAGWLAEQRGHPRFPGTVRRVASAARKGER